MPLGAFKATMLGAAGGGGSGDAWYAIYTGAYDSSNSYGDFDIGLDTTNELLYVGGRQTKTDTSGYANMLGVFSNYKTAPTYDATNSQFDTQQIYIGNDSYGGQYHSTNGYFDRPGKSPIVGCYGPANGAAPSAGYYNLWYFLADANLSNPADFDTNFVGRRIGFGNTSGSGYIYGNSTMSSGTWGWGSDEVCVTGMSGRRSAQMGWGGYYFGYVGWLDSSGSMKKTYCWGWPGGAHVVAFGANKILDDEAWQLGYQQGITSYTGAALCRITRASSSALTLAPRYLQMNSHTATQYAHNVCHKNGSTNDVYVHVAQSDSGSNARFGVCEIGGQYMNVTGGVGVYMSDSDWNKIDAGGCSSITDSENNHYLFIAAQGTGGYGMRGHVVKLSTAGTILWQRSLEINGITNPSSGGGYFEWEGVKLDDDDVPIVGFRISNASYYRSGVMRVPTDGGTAQGSATSWTESTSGAFSTQWLDDTLCTTQTTTFSINTSSLTATDTDDLTSQGWSRGGASSGDTFQFRGADSGNTFRGATVT
jgi:hypothetical protein